ncbi:reverse transcriptase domain-containing protein [Tanacetum coccineum]
MPTEMELTLEQTQQGVSYEVSNIRVNSFTMKMEILLESNINKPHGRFNTSAGNLVKKILLKLNLFDHRSVKVLQVKEFQERCNNKGFFKNGMSMSFQKSSSPQGGKVTRWRRDLLEMISMLKITMTEYKFKNNHHPRRMFLEESDEVEKYVGGLPDMIQGNVMSARPKTMQEAIELANDLMNQKVHAYAKRQAKNKRKFNNNNQAQQQLPKKPNVAQAYTSWVCHYKVLLETPTTTNNQRTITCYECRNKGHYGSDCPELKNRNHGNQAEDTKAHGVVYALGGEETDQDPNNIEDEIEAQEEDFPASTSEP